MHQSTVDAEPDFEQEIREYFASVEDAFESTFTIDTQSQRQSFFDVAFPIAIISAFLSVVPIIPVVIWALVRWLFLPRQVVFYGRVIPVGSFLFWYVTAALTFVAAAVLIGFLGNRKEKPVSERLDAAPIRFALCYALVQELDRYSKNRIPKHINCAAEYWPVLKGSLRSFLNPFSMRSGPMLVSPAIEVTSLVASDLDAATIADMRDHGFAGPGLTKYHSLFPQIELLRMSHSWFRLEPDTIKIVNGLNLLSVKITGDRLKDKKDLPSIAQPLKELAGYLYSEIPEVASTGLHNKGDLAKFGEQCLLQFAELIQNVPTYSPEPRALAPKERATRKLVMLALWFVALFSHENLLVRFSCWWFFSQSFVLAVLKITMQWVPTLKADSTLISLVIATPLVVSVAALAAPLKGK